MRRILEVDPHVFEFDEPVQIWLKAIRVTSDGRLEIYDVRGVRVHTHMIAKPRMVEP